MKWKHKEENTQTIMEEKKIEKTATRIRNNRTDPTMRIMLGNQIQNQIEKRKTAQKQQGIPNFIFKDSPAR